MTVARLLAEAVPFLNPGPLQNISVRIDARPCGLGEVYCIPSGNVKKPTKRRKTRRWVESASNLSASGRTAILEHWEE